MMKLSDAWDVPCLRGGIPVAQKRFQLLISLIVNSRFAPS